MDETQGSRSLEEGAKKAGLVGGILGRGQQGPQQGVVERDRPCRTGEGVPVVVSAAFSSTADPATKSKFARFYQHEHGTPQWGSPTHGSGSMGNESVQ